MEPKCLVIYKAGENTEALWLVGETYVCGNFRAHGHGEFNLSARNKGCDWVDLVSDMNYDFGRACDTMVQKMMQGEGYNQLLADIAKGFGRQVTNSDEALQFQNYLSDVLFQPIYEGVTPKIDDTIQGMVEHAISKGMDAEAARAWGNSMAVGTQVMDGPDFIRILDSGEDTEHGEAIAKAILDFTIDSLCNESRSAAGCDSPERREQDQAIIADIQQCIGARIVRQFERPMTAEEQAQ